ncbi:MAG: FAD-dependent oxidoreductase [Lachnospiraceae bacterium]|jgi:2,4-dienoyl-CoA reductase-like NADH-dependent reductase (Old Yellow Enzyme family)|nr:FAD-dependent oxidoreductase [Lachnospiraceae bacterium]
MQRRYPHLFSPIKVGNLVFKNRILAAPLGVWTFSPSNYVFDYAVSMFEERALGGAASVTVGHTEVNAEEDDTDGFGLYFNLRDRKGTAALSEFSYAVRQHGAHVGVQLNYGTGYYAASECFDHGRWAKEMDRAKITQTIGQYVDCAKKLKLTGFDIVMVHGAHGWLPAQFLSARTNKRTDEFGGSLENRLRFPVMLVDALREALGADFFIEYRISGFDPAREPERFAENIALIEAIRGKVNLIHISSGGPDSEGGTAHTFPTYLDPRATNVSLAAAVKEIFKDVPIAVVGNITEPETAERILAEGKADFVAMCRGLIADPHWPNKARRGMEEDIIPCIGCYNCLDTMHATHFIGCDVNPRTGREHRIGEVSPARTPKKVVVVGGGPAGMQAAITACDRGHEVTLFEKSGALGGLLRIADENPVKNRLEKYKGYLVRQVGKRPIKVLLGTRASAATVEACAPDAVIVAAGSEPIVPDIPGADRGSCLTVAGLHEHGAHVGDRVVVIGGNLAGCETALYLRSLGKEATIVEMRGELYEGANEVIRHALEAKLREASVRAYTGAQCVAVTNAGVTVRSVGAGVGGAGAGTDAGTDAGGSEAGVDAQDAGVAAGAGAHDAGDAAVTDAGAGAVHTQGGPGAGGTWTVPADTVVFAVGVRPAYETVAELADCAPDVVGVGDCVKAGSVREASRTGHYAALDI